MHKLKLKTFQEMAVRKKLASSKQKTVKLKAERNLLGQLLMLCQSHDVCLDKLFTYPLAPVLWCLATADRSMCKANKADLLHALETEGVESVCGGEVHLRHRWKCSATLGSAHACYLW